MTKDDLTVAAISLTATDDKARNIAQAFDQVRAAAAQGADWVQLPECFSYHGSYDRSYDAAESHQGPLYQSLAALAKELGIVLFAGTIGERPPQDTDDKIAINGKGQRRVYNTAYVFDRNGTEIAKYRKIHLFHLQASEQSIGYSESDGFIPGDTPVAFEVDGWRVGMSICYDLRFPELYAMLSESNPCDVFVVPSAFTRATGEAHWELLLRARAVEWQAYMFAANQCGEHAPGKLSYGHSLICDPWGRVLAATGDKPSFAMAQIKWTTLAKSREKLPALKNRRQDVYAKRPIQ